MGLIFELFGNPKAILYETLCWIYSGNYDDVKRLPQWRHFLKDPLHFSDILFFSYR